MLSEEQYKKIIEETIICVNALLNENLNQKEIEDKYNIPTSTVGRRLSNEKVLRSIYEDKAYTIIALIKSKQEENKKQGNSNGGRLTQERYGFVKDQNGKFNGPNRKK